MNEFEIALLPGDGIGIEVVASAVRVLKAVESRLNQVAFKFAEYPAGAAEYLRGGDPLPEKTIAGCGRADAILLGAMGMPQVRWPDGREMTPQIDLRERFQLYAGLRPIYLYHADDSPLKRRRAGEIDFELIRENTEGLFWARLGKNNNQANEACDTLRISRAGSERLFHYAFQRAQKRRHKITLVDKANVLPSMAYFRSIFDDVARKYPDVAAERIYVDAMALYLVKNPERYDVIVTENMFGDILSDLAAGIVGGMGMAPSADVGEDCAVFQPSHGTAPDIAGKGIANPVATILSAALMLDWLGHSETLRGAGMIRDAVRTMLSDPECRTPDLGGNKTTEDLTQKVLACL